MILKAINIGDSTEDKAGKQKQQPKQLLSKSLLPLPPSPDQQTLCGPAFTELLIVVT